MHPYLLHLLTDIENAHRIKRPFKSPYTKTFEEEMEEIEGWCEREDYEHSFSYYCGLKAENFPPAEQLTTEEINMVNKAFRKMMFTYNHDADFPETLPAALTYLMLVNTLNEKTFIPADGFVSFDYCSGYAPDCVFKEYCSCLKFWNPHPDEDISDSNFNDDELPF